MTGLRVGQIANISGPRNNFVLAGGRAANRLYCRWHRRDTVHPDDGAAKRMRQKKWRIHYSVRTRDRAALLREIEQLAAAGYGEVFAKFRW